MKRTLITTLMFVLSAAVAWTAPSRGADVTREWMPPHARLTAVAMLSDETIALLEQAGRDHRDLESRAVVDDGTVLNGSADETYRIHFDGLPVGWRTATIEIRLQDSGVFEHGLLSRWQPKALVDALSTAALLSGETRPVRVGLAAERLRRSVREVAAGSLDPAAVAEAKTGMMTALVTRAIINGELSGDIASYLGPDAPSQDLVITIPDSETGGTVGLAGHELIPNRFGIATAQDRVLRRGARPFMSEDPLHPRALIENPFHGRLRERAAHEHLDVFIDLDSGVGQIVPENTLPEEPGWDVCLKHLRDGWPYIRLNHLSGVAGANLGPVAWEEVVNVARVPLHKGPPSPGILIIAHGEPAPEWNLAVDKAVKRIRDLYPEYAAWPMELAFLEDEMLEEDGRNQELGLTGKGIGEALARLRDQNVAWVGVIPLMINNCSGHIEEIRWLMGQPVEALTSEWRGELTIDGNDLALQFEGFLGHKGADLSGEFGISGLDTDVPDLEGAFWGTVDTAGALQLAGELWGYSEDGNKYLELTLDEAPGATTFAGAMAGGYTGSWVKEERVGGTWQVVDEGDLTGRWELAATDEGRPDLAGLEVFLGSALEAHPLMRQINVERTTELVSGADPTATGLVLGIHGADLASCEASWEHMGEEILDDVLAKTSIAAAQAAPLGAVGEAVGGYLADPNLGTAAVTVHMVAPGSLTQAMPYIIGWPQVQPNVHYQFNQKALLAFENQELFNLPYPPFGELPTLTATELDGLTLDSTSDLFVDWMAQHAVELISAYPVDDNWHGDKAGGLLEMTDNVYVIKTDQNRYAKMRVFSAGRGMISLEYAYQRAPGRRVLR